MQATTPTRTLPRVLRKGEIYLAPSGRCCMLAPYLPGRDTLALGDRPAVLVYHLPNGQPGSSKGDDAFFLSPANFSLLRRLG
jgi:hypothetical protein